MPGRLRLIRWQLEPVPIASLEFGGCSQQCSPAWTTGLKSVTHWPPVLLAELRLPVSGPDLLYPPAPQGPHLIADARCVHLCHLHTPRRNSCLSTSQVPPYYYPPSLKSTDERLSVTSRLTSWCLSLITASVFLFA